MKRLVFLFILLSMSGFGQKVELSLDSCIRMAKRNYPLIKQNSLLEENSANNIKAINKNWLPHLSYTSQATYQSEATRFELPSSGFDLVAPDKYFTNSLDLDQTLFDAGQIRQQKRVEKLNEESELRKNEVELYKLADRVNQLYSNILLVRANIKTLTIYKDDIDNKKAILSSSVNNGLALQSNMDELDAEELKTEQSIVEAKDNLDAMYQSLAMFINKITDDSTGFSILSVNEISQGNDITRPEIKWFSAQKNLLDARHKLNNSTSFPRISLFADGSYGRMGYNFLNLDPRLYGIAGIRLKWNIGTLYNYSVEKQNIIINKKMIDIQEEVFEFNLKAALTTQYAEITSLKSIIEKDKMIIEKRHAITLAAASQLENGNITSTDYLTQLNAEMQATLNQKIHEIKLMNAVATYNTTKGITNF